MSTPPTLIGSLSELIEAATSPSVLSRRSTIRATAWSRNAIAKVVTSITAGDWPRRGRKTTVSIASESATTTPKHAAMLHGTGHAEVKASVYAPAMTSWP